MTHDEVYLSGMINTPGPCVSVSGVEKSGRCSAPNDLSRLSHGGARWYCGIQDPPKRRRRDAVVMLDCIPLPVSLLLARVRRHARRSILSRTLLCI